MSIPLYAFLEGDTLGLLLVVQAHDSIRKVAEQLLQAAAVRVQPFANPLVYVAGRPLESNITVMEAGLNALDRIDVRRAETPWPRDS